MWPFKRKSKQKKRPTRLRIFVWALIICGIATGLQLFLPLEDIYRGGRSHLRAQPADGKVVVVTIDDGTIRQLGSVNYSRENDAKVVSNLLKAGANRVYFDRAFADPVDQTGDNMFAATLAKHRGQVFLGTILSENPNTGALELITPTKPIADSAELRSLSSIITPFYLSVEVFYSADIHGKQVPGIGPDIAGVHGNIDEKFRPDWSIQTSTIPTLSYINARDGKFSNAAVAGKDIIIGKTTLTSSDWIQVVGQGWFPGVFAHAVAAQTLRHGHPRDIGGWPALGFAAGLSALFLRARSRKQAGLVLFAATIAGLSVPFLLDSLLVTADFLPAYLLFGIVAVRATSHRDVLEASRRNAGTLMPNLSALREEPLAGRRPVIAMRIRNYAAIRASFAESVEDELMSEIARRLDLPGQVNTYYQAEDVLYWLAPELSEVELRGHVEGLARLIESHFVIRERTLDIQMAFGIDMDFSRTVANRIGRALLAADIAAGNHELVMFNTSNNDEDSAWELSLMSELDAAIDNGDIWIAYQPQFNLRDNLISGAEALVRWQHPTRGAISPEAFILPAEAHNRISKLTFHILEQATRSVRALVAENPRFRLSVNLSANLLQQEHLPFKISQVLARTGFAASNLTLEVTESAPFKEHELVKKNLAGIAALGIDLSIDDYGTGNATLEYLRSVPCQEIKIDRRFVVGLVDNSSDMMLVESTIVLAHGLGRRVIAEGIEDPETLSLLRAIGCDIVQGYYLAKPMQLDALRDLLAREVTIQAA
ncbi:MAG: EAL domain-containing protein [Novosphingobium sp.]